MPTTPKERIPNAVALIHKIAAGWTAPQCWEMISELSPSAAQRWSHVVEGAEVAFRSMKQPELEEVAGQLWDYLDEVANGKAVA